MTPPIKHTIENKDIEGRFPTRGVIRSSEDNTPACWSCRALMTDDPTSECGNLDHIRSYFGETYV